MQITLPSEIEHALVIHARNFGITPEIVALEVLKERFSPVSTEYTEENHETLADYLSGYIWVISSSSHVPGGAQMSKNCGKKFAKGLLKKRQKGLL